MIKRYLKITAIVAVDAVVCVLLDHYAHVPISLGLAATAVVGVARLEVISGES